MSTKNDSDVSKSPSDKKAKEDERNLDEIEKELDELRPKPPSPRTQHRIEEEEKKKDHTLQEHHTPAAPIEVKSDNENQDQKHKEGELTPGKPDPTVNDNIKIPVLNERGDIELKPQQGSTLNKNQEKKSSDS